MERTKLEQGRAAFAYQKAVEGKGLGTTASKEYKAYAKRIPMLIKTNGLGNALAFMKSAKKKTYLKIYNQLSDWLIRESKTTNFYFPDQNEDLVNAVINLESSEYRAVTVETLAFFNWLRRFADGLIEGETTTND